MSFANMGDRGEWGHVVRLLRDRGIIVPICEPRIFRYRGVEVLNGMFAMRKPAKPVQPNVAVCRLIFDIAFSNAFQRAKSFDVKTMRHAVAWLNIILLPDKKFLWSSSVLTSAFYSVALPHQWVPSFALKRVARGAWIGMGNSDFHYVSAVVMPMGWTSAMSIFHTLHKGLATSAVNGACLGPRKGWRRHVVQADMLKLREFFHVYVDNFDLVELVSASVARDLEGIVAALHALVASAYESSSTPFNSEKNRHRQSVVERLGAGADGVRGVWGTTPGRRLKQMVHSCLLCLEKVLLHWFSRKSSDGVCTLDNSGVLRCGDGRR